jgi:hypothetical protein
MLLRQKQADILERLFQEHSVAENLRSFAPVCCCSGVLSSVATVAANQQLAAAGSGASNFPNNQPYNAPQPSGIILPSSSPPTISSPFVVFCGEFSVLRDKPLRNFSAPTTTFSCEYPHNNLPCQCLSFGSPSDVFPSQQMLLLCVPSYSVMPGFKNRPFDPLIAPLWQVLT